MRKITLSLLAILLSIQFISAQNQKDEFPKWVQMMSDESANFYDVQAEFNAYWAGKSPAKSSGWKVFKRWEYMMQFQIDENGNRIPADQVYKRVNNFKSQRTVKSDANWTNIGPINLPINTGTGQPNGMGRVNAIAFHPTDADIVFIGAPQGGLWKTADGGSTWEVLTDDQPTLGVSSIIINHDNADIILIGTGDRDAGDSNGMGVFKSTDGGETWTVSNDGMGNRTVGRMIQDPNDSDIILAATDGGVYKSSDMGATWTQSQSGNFKDILFKPDNSSVVYTISSNNFYKSTDNGDSFTNSSSGLPGGSRGAIAVTPANPEVVYVLLSSGSVYGSTSKSDDAGDSWTVKSTSPNIFDYSCDGSGSNGQGWYDMDIAIDPNDENFVYVGGVNTWVSSNSGSNWSINSHWYGGCGVPSVHADMHVYEINPLNNRLYNGNDGGLYYTDNQGDSWPQISSGLAISQIYKIGSSATVKDLVINGYQDNGTATFTSDGWKTVMGGDGMDCAIDPVDPTYSYGEYYYGAIDRIKNNSQNQGNIVGGISEEGAWVTPFLISYADANTMFVGMKGVWRTNNVKANSTSQVQWTKITDFSGSNCSMLEQSDANPDILWVGKGSSMYMTLNANDEAPTWNIVTNMPGSGDIRSIATNPNNEDDVYMARGNGIYYSNNLCETWTDISGSLPSIAMNSIVFYKNSGDGLYVGANAGIYYKDSNLDDWVLYNDGFPLSSRITELEIYYDAANPSQDLLRASTYGRGLWETPMFQGVLTANFSADQTNIPSGCTVQFSDLSIGVPTSWNWTFEGGTPATSTEQNPIVAYENNGEFDVTLEVTNVNGSESITEENYISVVAGLTPEVHFSASQQGFCEGDDMIVEFTDESLYCPTAWTWTFNPSSVNFLEGTDANSQNPKLEFTANGSYDVSLEVLNSNGSSTSTELAYIQSGGSAIPFFEDFEGEDPLSRGWIIENEDDGITWKDYNVAGTEGSKAMGINFHDYVNFGARDRLITPALSLPANFIDITFKHAYTQYYSAYTDSLIVLISTDCGENWTRIFEKGEDGNGTFATHELTTDAFVPAESTDWCGSGWGSECYSIDISEYGGMNNVKIAFESYNMRGNYLYIDDIMIDFYAGIDNTQINENLLSIFPNPSNGEFSINLIQNMKDAQIEIYDQLGQQVFFLAKTDITKAEEFRIKLEGVSTGVYLMKISNEELSIQDKIIVE
ncbi:MULTISPECIES: PKD domain-containing protein [unclassified Lentimicrobium]|uniref:PKD domain-containing protein n=1 Tax=unclassified Lentimicrobium TaxID=2677434 RepID=UPI0015565679|nr:MULTISPECIES: PKD domain-containing protein [unclassified Lentimicrobium]NPD45767.1 PKD domain-containing protein [Lentimicrobium sp. S6]NPD84782.1 PKD domain-containing protein [Lentimicrobium sp. L6]